MRATANGNIMSYKPQNNESFTVTVVSTEWIKVKASGGTEGQINWAYFEKTGNGSGGGSGGGTKPFQQCVFTGYVSTMQWTWTVPNGSTLELVRAGETASFYTYKNGTGEDEWLGCAGGYIEAKHIKYFSGGQMNAEADVKLYLREKPSSLAGCFAIIGQGIIVRIIDDSRGDWIRISTSVGTGWVEAHTILKMG